jgi:transcriptional regulator
LHDLIDAFGFGTLISAGADGPVATHLPFLIDRNRGPNGTLVCHMARANPHWRTLGSGPSLAVFLGPHGYVSPSWYAASPAVPTWNYAAVHAYGAPRLVEDSEGLRDIVMRLTARHEAGRLPSWSVESLPPAFMANMMRGIVGIEIEIARLEGKRKLSQNRAAADREGVVAALNASGHAGDRDLAGYMAQHAGPSP